MQPEHIAKQTAALSIHWQTIFREIKVRHLLVSRSTILNNLHLKQFPLADIPDNFTSALSSTQVRRMNRQSHFCHA